MGAERNQTRSCANGASRALDRGRVAKVSNSLLIGLAQRAHWTVTHTAASRPPSCSDNCGSPRPLLNSRGAQRDYLAARPLARAAGNTVGALPPSLIAQLVQHPENSPTCCVAHARLHSNARPLWEPGAGSVRRPADTWLQGPRTAQ
jgi:hypothetical protein